MPDRLRLAVIGTPSPGEVLAVFQSAGLVHNVTVRDAVLAAALDAAVTDDDRHAAEAAIFAVAETLIANG